MNPELARILTQMGARTGDPTRVERTQQLGDGRVLTVRPDGRAFVTQPERDPAHSFGPRHADSTPPAPVLLRELGCTERIGWQHGKLVMLCGRNSDKVAAGLGKVVAGWGGRHGPVRWTPADQAPHDWKEVTGDPAVWNTPECNTLIVGKVWPMLSVVQLDYLLRLCQSRRSKSIILAAEVPNPMTDKWRALVEYVQRDGVVTLTETSAASPARGRAPFGEPDR